MKKASYLQWMMLMGATAILASACVVTSSSDDDDDFFDGGEGGTSSSTAGKTSTGGAGKSSTSGSTSGGTAGSATAGTGGSGTAGTGGTGGTATEEAGLCLETDGSDPTPTALPSCAPDDKDANDACRKCMRASCCDEWQTCYGDTPHTACGWGADAADDYEGQYDCIRNCYAEKIETSSDSEEMIKYDCSFECLKQCESDGLPLQATSDLVDCASMNCNDECFPPPM